MFDYLWLTKNVDHIIEAHDPSVRRLVPVIWSEHCVECSAPDCYKTCSLYRSRMDGECLRIEGGMVPLGRTRERMRFGAQIHFCRWAKIECIYDYRTLKQSDAYSLYKKLDRFGGTFSSIARALPGSEKKWIITRGVYSLRQRYIRRVLSERGMDPETLSLQILARSAKPCKMIIELKTKHSTLFRSSFLLDTEYSSVSIPLPTIKSDEYVFLAVCPENVNEEIDVSFELLEMIGNMEKKESESRDDRKVKLVVWDLDNTLWDGILGEDGIEGIRLKSNITGIIQELDAKGIINSIASKNDEENAMKALRHFGLENLFVAPMINWKPKSENVKAIAEALDLGMDTFVFVDDTDNELEEVRTNCPQVRVCSTKNIDQYVLSGSFDVPVSEESKLRRQSYQEIAKRNEDKHKYKNDITRFLIDCEMVMHIHQPDPSEYKRCYEILQRTNQLNISGKRLSEEELLNILASDDYDCFRIKVDDKYGNYGLVGLGIFDVSNKDTIILDHFVFSCRAARKKLEQSFFEYMVDYYRDKNAGTLQLKCRRTERNELMQTILKESELFDVVGDTGESFVLSADLKKPHKYTNIAVINND